MNTYIRRYICTGLATAPDVLAHLLQGITPDELDAAHAPDRFTLREMVAHLADWEPIWFERIRRIATEDNPNLPSYDEGQFAIDHDYANANFEQQLRLYTEGRAKLVAYLQDLEMDAWYRVGTRDELGEVTLLSLAAMIQGHDSYHLRQVLEFRGMLRA